MLRLKKILFPFDFSDRCRGAAHVVKALARRFEAEVTLFHVVEPGSVKTRMVDLLNQARQQMENSIAAELSGCNTKQCVSAGDPALSIVEAAHRGQFDLIVIPTHGYGPFRRFLLGAVTAKVLHDASCAVWTSTHLEDWPAIENVALRNILCGIDFGPRSTAALRCAAQLAVEFRARLTVAHTISGFDAVPWSPGARDQALRSAEERVRRIEATLDISLPVEVLDGKPASGLSEIADRLNADLLVIGRTHVTEDFPKVGSNAYSIVVHSPCPVLSI